MKKETLILSSAEPIDDGGRKLNILYLVLAVVMAIILGNLPFGVVLGLVAGWLVKNIIMRIKCITIREQAFYVENKLPYQELANRLIPLLTPLGAMIERSSKDEKGILVISFQGSTYDVGYNEDNSFYIWWRKNIAKALFMIDYIGAYRKEVIAMGIIAYHVQQVCDHYSDSGNEVLPTNNEKKFCANCGEELVEKAQYCKKCGRKI